MIINFTSVLCVEAAFQRICLCILTTERDVRMSGRSIVTLKPMRAGLSGSARMQPSGKGAAVMLSARGVKENRVEAYFYCGGEYTALGGAYSGERGELTVKAEIKDFGMNARDLRVLLLLGSSGGERDGAEYSPLMYGVCSGGNKDSAVEARSAMLALCGRMNKRSKQAEESTIGESGAEDGDKADILPSDSDVNAYCLKSAEIHDEPVSGGKIAVCDEIPSPAYENIDKADSENADDGIRLSFCQSSEGNEITSIEETQPAVPEGAFLPAIDPSPYFTAIDAGERVAAVKLMNGCGEIDTIGVCTSEERRNNADNSRISGSGCVCESDCTCEGLHTSGNAAIGACTSEERRNNADNSRISGSGCVCESDCTCEGLHTSGNAANGACANGTCAEKTCQTLQSAFKRETISFDGASSSDPAFIAENPLPRLIYPAEFDFMEHFFTALIPENPFNMKGWRFVRANEDGSLLLGRFVTDGRVSRVAYALAGAIPPDIKAPFRAIISTDGAVYQLLVQHV